MPRYNISESKVRVVIKFIQILKDKNYITLQPVKKQIIENLFQHFSSKESENIKFFELINIMKSMYLITYKNQDYIHFKPNALKNIDFAANKNDKSCNSQNIRNGFVANNANSGQHLNKKSTPIINNNTQPVNSTTKKQRKNRRFESRNNTVPSKKLENNYVTKEQCAYCNFKFYTDNQYTKHIEEIAHKLRQTYRTNKKSLLNDTTNIIDFETERGGVKLTEIKSNVNIHNTITCKITNKSEKAVYEVTNLILLYTKLKELKLDYSLPILLKFKNPQTISIDFSFRYEGMYILPIIFKIENKTSKNEKPKYILKEMVFHIQSNLLKGSSNNKESYPTVSYLEDLPIIDGVRPPKDDLKELTCVVKLPFYDLPKIMTKLINWEFKMDERMTPVEQQYLIKIRELLNVPDRNNCFTSVNHCKMLKTLLQFEEHQMSKDIRRYNCYNQTMILVPKRERDICRLLALEVPGLAENRPSLIRGDDLIVRTPGGKCYYRGYVHRVNDNSVELGFFQRYVIEEHFDAQKYSVSFRFNRRTIRIEHQAVELARKHNISHYFFPTKPPKPRPLDAIQFVWYQTNIKNNPEQQQAVRHIVSGTAYPNPYLLFGPPGTGKTMTMVESILQLWSRKPKSRILVAAPSNSAANEVTTRLAKFIAKKDIFRMISQSFAYDKIPDDIKSISNTNEGKYFYPAMETLERYRIVIVTLTAAAKFVWGGVTPGHFTHIFIDESGHSTESEVLIPIAGIISSEQNKGQLSGQIVLAGDPKQLGPIIHSKLAQSFGFGTSMLERLMNTCEVYQKKDNKYNPNMVTKLLKNFRSNKAILKLPDEMFYDKELIAEGNDLTDIALGWEELPNKKFPLIFHNVQGEDRREGRSPSYFNIQERDVVVEYLRSLVGKRLKGRIIKQSDIGIVSPYRKQVHKLQEVCKKNNWHDILIGSVEQFQGQERLIIIISTVRSKLNLVEHDYKFHLGFLKNPKRFNVAVTRAKALVIVVGNPNILMWDEHWGKFIEYCSLNNALKGPRFELRKLWLRNEDNNNNELENLTLENEIVNGTDEHADFSRGNS